MVHKWNPRTARYENTTPPTTTPPTQAKTGTATGSKGLTRAQSEALGRGKMNEAVRPLPAANKKWTDNGWQNTPVGGTYVDTKTGETKKRNPSNTPDTVIKAAAPKPSKANPVIDAWLKEQFPDNSPAENNALAAYMSSQASSGSGGVTASQKQNRAWELEDQRRQRTQALQDQKRERGFTLEDRKAEAERAKQGAGELSAAGAKAQEQYNLLAQKGFTDAQTASQGYYKTQADQANASIDKATSDYLASLVAPTAYSNVPIAQLTPQQQGLMGNLQAYGATGQQAQQQQTQDAGFNDFMSQLLSRGTQQMQQADQGYYEALKNAGTGGQAAARIGVAQNTAAMQGRSTAEAEAMRQRLLQAGIEALMSGQMNAANRLAQ